MPQQTPMKSPSREKGGLSKLYSVILVDDLKREQIIGIYLYLNNIILIFKFPVLYQKCTRKLPLEKYLTNQA